MDNSSAPEVEAAPIDTGASTTTTVVEQGTRHAVVSTRAGRTWVRILPGMVVLAVGLIFVFQNTQRAKVSFFTISGTMPLAVALLVAFALGASVVLLLGSIRILQLRKAVRHPEQ